MQVTKYYCDVDKKEEEVLTPFEYYWTDEEGKEQSIKAELCAKHYQIVMLAAAEKFQDLLFREGDQNELT